MVSFVPHLFGLYGLAERECVLCDRSTSSPFTGVYVYRHTVPKRPGKGWMKSQSRAHKFDIRRRGGSGGAAASAAATCARGEVR